MELSEPLPLNRELCLRYKERLTSFYYSNIKSCSFMEGFSYEDAEQKIDGLIEHVSNGSAMVYGVFDSESLIGYIWAYEHPFREEIRIYVNEIHVDEAYRNRGIGKQLLSAVESLARERGYGALHIHAEGDNDGAIRLYQSISYVKIVPEFKYVIRLYRAKARQFHCWKGFVVLFITGVLCRFGSPMGVLKWMNGIRWKLMRVRR